MGTLTAIRKQGNPDGIEGHEERQVMQEESNKGYRKKNYTRGRDYHKYNLKKPLITKQGYDPEKVLMAREFCETQCKNKQCPLSNGTKSEYYSEEL